MLVKVTVPNVAQAAEANPPLAPMTGQKAHYWTFDSYSPRDSITGISPAQRIKCVPGVNQDEEVDGRAVTRYSLLLTLGQRSTTL